jgi:hypothetical protein
LATQEQLEVWLAERDRLLQFMLGTGDAILLQTLRDELASVERSIQSCKEELAKER